MSIGRAWEEASAFLRREGRLIVPVALALFALPSILLNWAFPAGTANNSSSVASLVLLAMLIALLVGQMTIIVLATDWAGSLGEAIGKAVRRVPTMFGAALLVFAPLVVIFSIALAAVLAAAGIADPRSLTPAEMAKIPVVAWIGLLMLLIVAYLSVRMLPMTAIAVNESAGPVALLKRSWSLTRGQFGRLLLTFALLVIAGLALSAAVSIVAGSLAVLLLGEPQPFNLPALTIAIAGGIVSAAVSSVSAAMVGRIYVQLTGNPAAA